MIKRFFKTIFILSLCLGITLPANAGSANVSDGSAFITKSELSYQLNNLSSRMTQLENSLDSKIDTLVSSYLTRNGIWNGVEVPIASDGSSAFAGLYLNTNATGRLLAWGTDAYFMMSGSSYKLLRPYTSSITSGTLVNSCSKSGLFFFEYRYQLSRTDATWGVVNTTGINVCVGTTNSSETVNGDWPSLIVGATFMIAKGSVVLWSISQSVVCPIPSYLKAYYVPNATGSFFVSKGDTLVWNILNLTSANYSGGYNGGRQNNVFRFQVLKSWIY